MAEETVQTVERALTVLRAFSRDRPEIRSSELARTLGLSRTIVIRILNTLERAGFVERVPGDARYRIGLAAFEVGALYLASNRLVDVAGEILDELVERTGYTAYLGVLDGGDAVILSLREGRCPVRFLWSAGNRLPVTTTAFGKAMLMYMTAGEIDHILGRGHLPGLTGQSIKTRAELDAQLDGARERGWIVAEDESYPSVSAIGAAILDGQGSPIAGLSLSFLNYPPDPDVYARLGPLIHEAAQKVARRVEMYHAYGQRAIL